MNDKQARDAAQQIMANDPVGTQIFLTSEGMALNPHGFPLHADGYEAHILPNGQVVVHKFHAFDIPGFPIQVDPHR